MLIEHALRTVSSRGADAGPGAGSGGPADVAAAVPPRLVLVIDQLEELFTAGADADAGTVEREAFIAALHAAATIPAGPQKLPQALVIAAVRADFLGRLIAYPPLRAALDAGPFTVGPMSEAELRLAMTGPAAEAGLAVEPAVVEAVIAELREGARGGLGSGVLPLMSQAMATTWEHREGDGLTLRSYRRAGGVANAVNRSAQTAYDALTQPAAGRGASGIHPAHRHHGGRPARAAPVQPDRSALPRRADRSRHQRSHRRLQRPSPARPRHGQRRDLP